MKKRMLVFTLILAAGLAGNCFAEGTYSGRALEESAKASSHASIGAMHGIVASGQAVSAVAAVPFIVAGSVGGVSTEIARGLTDAATATPGAPLPVADEIVTASPPPDQALKENACAIP